jgi:hypothetical protein
MRVRSLAALVAAVAVSVTLAACGATDSTAPTTPAVAAPDHVAAAPTDSANQSLLGGLLGGLLGSTQEITPLLRTTNISSPITVSKRIGILGGVIAIPQAGLTIVVPPLAVPVTKTISVTALAGNKVAYEFAPHGLKFTLPLVMTQNLRNTEARSGGLLDALSLKVGYFPDANRVTSVTELLNVQVDLLNQTAITTLWHFSGYIYASGRRGGDSF